MTDEWVELVDELGVGESRTVKTRGRQLAVFRTSEDAACVIDNRCPHEGYPLASGGVVDGVLTCAWHNWKFRLADGACLVGGESVRAYESRCEGGRVLARLTDPPVEGVRAQLFDSLAEAIDDDDVARSARTIERLLQTRIAPRTVLAWMVRLAARRLPWGFDHGLAASADLAAMLESEPAGRVLLQAQELLFAQNARRETRGAPVAQEGRLEDLPATVRAEDLEGGVGLAAGEHEPKALFDAFAVAATDGFLDFGHGLIFTRKAEELIARLGPEVQADVAASLARSMVFATREETLPPMREFMGSVDGREALELMYPLDDDSTDGAPTTPESSAYEWDEFLSAVLDGTLDDALDAVDACVAHCIRPDRIALALALAASERLLRFNPSHELDGEVQEGWLHVTHALTYAESLHAMLEQRPSTAALRGLRYAARFVEHLRPLDEEPTTTIAAPRQKHATLEAALDARDEAAARAWVREATLPELQTVLTRDTLSDRMTRAIFVAHHIKTTVAALRVANAAERDSELHKYARRPLEGLVRWLCHPVRERRVSRASDIARAFVVDGRRTRRLVK